MEPDHDQIESLLDRWEEAFEQGDDITVSELCAECPNLAPQVEVKIEQLRRLNGLLDKDKTVLSDGQQLPRPTENVKVESRFGVFDFIDGGGLGSVFTGRDELLKRDAAIKFLQKPHAGNPDIVKQFKTECEITSRLDHPGIVPIYGHGKLPDGQPYYVMRRIAGQNLKEYADRIHEKLSPSAPTSEQRLELHSLLSTFVSVCRTIHYAHCRGVIHRDIKPANIMLGKHGEAMVLDWGLAQSVDRDEKHQTTEETLSVTFNKMVQNSAAGTPVYMSPEQHVGTGDVSILSDVYSLGATLYVLLSGSPPFEAKTLPELKKKVVHGKRVSLRSKYKWLSPALQAICDKAMSVQPEDRYLTAMDLALDIERYLADEPVVAYPESAFRRASRWVTRNRYLSFVVGTGLLCSLLGSFLYSSIVTRYARKERTALVHAKSARVQSLRLAAGFAANSVALKLSERWRILEIAARDERLIKLMQEIPDDAQSIEWPSFQNQLLHIKESYHLAAGTPDSWFLCDKTGMQMARVPAGSSIGKSYAHRDYFHGGKVDDTVDTEGKSLPKHIENVHRSKVYVSSSTGALKVAITRPIWSQMDVNPNRKFLGILGMSVSLGEFKELQTGLGNEQLVLVVDTDQNTINDETYDGMLLHHPELVRRDREKGPATFIDEALIEMLRIRNKARQDFTEHPDQANLWTADILNEFSDPLDPAELRNQHWIAAFAPIVVKGRPTEIADTGWGVIVAEREDNEPGIFGFQLKVLNE